MGERSDPEGQTKESRGNGVLPAVSQHKTSSLLNSSKACRASGSGFLSPITFVNTFPLPLYEKAYH